MAHLARQLYTCRVPAGAEKSRVKGKPGVRWKRKNNTWQQGVLIEGKPGWCRVESAKWYVYYTDENGKRRQRPGFTDRNATQSLLSQIVQKVEQIKSGLLPPEVSRPKLTLEELLDRWAKHARHTGVSPQGAVRTRQRAQAVVAGVGARQPSDITPSAVLAWINQRRAGGMANGTGANYIASVKSFTRWLVIVERCEPVDYLSGLTQNRDHKDIRRRRRSLTPGELTRLLSATKASSATHYELSGRERHALYLLACSTGLRAIECASLVGTDFNFASNTVTVRKPAKTRKRDEDVLPLPPDVARQLAEEIDCANAQPVWPNRGAESSAWWLCAARMIRRDLTEAGIPHTDSEGLVFDFHALRGQFATDLDRAGVTLARAQKLMRHSTPTLTAKHYTKPAAAELAAEVAKLKRS